MADHYADRQLWYPYYRLSEAGAEVEFVGVTGERCNGRFGIPAKAERCIDEVNPTELDALIIPGGDDAAQVHKQPQVKAFVRSCIERGAVVAAIGEGSLLLTSSQAVEGRRVTGCRCVREDLLRLGAQWVDQEVVRDGNLISSRSSDDLPAFCRAISDTLG